MNNKFCDSPIHKFSSLALAFIIILSCCVLPSFASADSIRPNEPVGYHDGDTFRDIIAVVLDSWGISFSGGNLVNDMDTLLEEFYSEQNHISDEFWRYCQIGVNKLGQLILDHTTVGKIIQFTQWLINKYHLDNNSTVTISDSSTYNPNFLPIVYSESPAVSQMKKFVSYSESDSWYEAIISSYPVAACFVSNGSGNAYYLNISAYPATFRNILFGSAQNTYICSTVTLHPITSGPYAGTYYYVTDNANAVIANSTFHVPFFESFDQAFGWFETLGYIVINTHTIDIPEESPSDGLLVDVPDAQWGMTLSEILDLIERLIGLYDNTQLEIISLVESMENLYSQLTTPISVDNIPGGVIMDYNDYDIPLENEWGLFDIFYNSEGDDISLFRPWRELVDIIYGFPAPILSFFSLVVLFVVAYGFIRMGRDSH